MTDPLADLADERAEWGDLHGITPAPPRPLVLHCAVHDLTYTAPDVVNVECPRCLDDEYDRARQTRHYFHL